MLWHMHYLALIRFVWTDREVLVCTGIFFFKLEFGLKKRGGALVGVNEALTGTDQSLW